MNNNKTTISGELLESAQSEIASVLQKLHTETNGLTVKEAQTRFKQYGPNEIAQEKSASALIRLIANVKNPLVILLVVLGVVSYLTGDMRATIMIFAMVLLGVFLRFFQELRSDKAAEKLKAMVRTVADVVRAGEKKEIPLKGLVPGDIVLLSAGDMVPADVGISVNSAVDIAKESSDIILLKQSLLVLKEGVIEGRKVFGNIIKYIKMAASSNFGNMFSVVGASIFLPFLPMLPLQVLANNLLYDLSQTTIPTDDVDQEWLMKPRKWAMGEIRRFILFIGPISSIFDYATFFMMLYLFKAWDNGPLFHTGWFIESLFTQTLIIHVIRTNKVPFIQSRASLPLIVSSLIIVAFGAWLPTSFLLPRQLKT
jgi:magnesium-transporting ATPase (P-type)